MTYDLSKVVFQNNLFTYETEDETLLFYALDESIDYNGDATPIKEILIATVDEEGNQTLLSSVIGLTYNGFRLTSDNAELEGAKLSLDNMSQCKLEKL